LPDNSWGCKTQEKVVKGRKLLVRQKNGTEWEAEVTEVVKIYSWGGCLVRTTGKPIQQGSENCARCASLYGTGDVCPVCGNYCGW
jgi:hypothetical protein